MKIGFANDHSAIDMKAELIPWLEEQGYENDITDTRMHHEIYLSDARKTEPAKMKTVIIIGMDRGRIMVKKVLMDG